MTAQEAIRRLEDHFAIHNDGRPTPYLDEAVQMAYKALEYVSYMEKLADKVNEIPEEYLMTEAEVRKVLGLER